MKKKNAILDTVIIDQSFKYYFKEGVVKMLTDKQEI